MKITTKESNKIIPVKKEVIQTEIVDAPVQEQETIETISPVLDLDLNEI